MAAVKEVETLIETVWEKFIGDEGSPEDLSDVLWTAYPIYPDSRRTVRGERSLLSSATVRRHFMSSSCRLSDRRRSTPRAYDAPSDLPESLGHMEARSLQPSRP